MTVYDVANGITHVAQSRPTDRRIEMEEAGYTFDRGEDYFRIDMFDCPSKGHLIRRGLAKVDTSITYKFRGKFINYEKIGNGIEVEC